MAPTESPDNLSMVEGLRRNISTKGGQIPSAGRRTILPVPHNQPVSAAPMTAHLPISPRLATTRSFRTTRKPASRFKVAGPTAVSGVGTIQPDLRFCGLMTGVPSSTYSDFLSEVPNGPVNTSRKRSPNLAVIHPSGTSAGISSLVISGNIFDLLIFLSLTSLFLSAVTRFNSMVAGSSSGTCGTSLPRTASWSTNSRSRAIPFGASAIVSKFAMKSREVMPCVPALPPGLGEAAPARPLPRPVPSRTSPAIRRDLRGPAPARSGSRGPG